MENTERITIKKVKYSKAAETVQINYEKTVNGNAAEYAVTYKEKPRPEFYKAFEALAPSVAVMLNLTEIQDITDRLVPYGLAMSRKSDGTLKVKILNMLQFPELKDVSPLHTPVMTEYTEENKAKEGKYLTEDATKKIHAVLDEVELYISGKRAQMSLFDDEGMDHAVHAETQVAGRIAAAAPSTGKMQFN